MKMGAVRSTGFTIIEVLLVLVVNAALFAVIVVFLSGRQARTEFTQSVRHLETKMNTAVNSVINGSYENKFICSAPADPNAPPVVSPVVNGETGTNKGCIFLGTIIVPYSRGMATYALVGRQYSLPGVITNNFQETHAVYIPTTQDVFTTKFETEITGMYDKNSTSDPVGAIAFINQIAGTGSGSGTPLLYAIDNVLALQPAVSLPDESVINNTANYRYLSEGIGVCMKGGVGQHAELIIGGGASILASNIVIDEDGICQ